MSEFLHSLTLSNKKIRERILPCNFINVDRIAVAAEPAERERDRPSAADRKRRHSHRPRCQRHHGPGGEHGGLRRTRL